CARRKNRDFDYW
nr:immunoglobulin heavy chain junction region [Mus musculus]